MPCLADALRVLHGTACLWVMILSQFGRTLAPVLGVRPQTIYQPARRCGGKAEVGEDLPDDRRPLDMT